MLEGHSVVKTLQYVGAQAREEMYKRAGGRTAQYVYKYDDEFLHIKVTADLTPKKAHITQSIVWENEPPEVISFDLDYEKDAAVYPLFVGCPADCYIYTFNEFKCKGERELKMFFSKNAVDLGGGAAFIFGTALPDLTVIDFLYPCTRT